MLCEWINWERNKLLTTYGKSWVSILSKKKGSAWTLLITCSELRSINTIYFPATYDILSKQNKKSNKTCNFNFHLYKNLIFSSISGPCPQDCYLVISFAAFDASNPCFQINVHECCGLLVDRPFSCLFPFPVNLNAYCRCLSNIIKSKMYVLIKNIVV